MLTNCQTPSAPGWICTSDVEHHLLLVMHLPRARLRFRSVHSRRLARLRHITHQVRRYPQFFLHIPGLLVQGCRMDRRRLRCLQSPHSPRHRRRLHRVVQNEIGTTGCRSITGLYRRRLVAKCQMLVVLRQKRRLHRLLLRRRNLRHDLLGSVYEFS